MSSLMDMGSIFPEADSKRSPIIRQAKHPHLLLIPCPPVAAVFAESDSVKDAQAVCCDFYDHPSSSRGKRDSSSLCNKCFNS